MLIALFALAFAVAPVQSAGQTPAPAAANTQTADASSTPAPAQAEPRQVCRFETVTGSNRRTRVCRPVSASTTQDQTTREMMRDLQRPRMPDS